MDKWMELARTAGFSNAVFLNVSALEPLSSVRDMCAADKCQAYGKNWTCPPACGTLKECAARMHSYRRGLLLQTTGKLRRDIDTKGYERTEVKHRNLFYQFSEQIRREYPDALCLGAGGCRICETCAYPAPCRFPARACSSMEGYGLFVTKVCRDNGIPYYYGPRTITFSACVLYENI